MKVMKRIIGMALIFTLMTCGTAFAGLKDVRNSLLNTYTQSRLLADTCVSDGDITPNSARGRVFSAGESDRCAAGGGWVLWKISETPPDWKNSGTEPGRGAGNSGTGSFLHE